MYVAISFEDGQIDTYYSVKEIRINSKEDSISILDGDALDDKDNEPHELETKNVLSVLVSFEE